MQAIGSSSFAAARPDVWPGACKRIISLSAAQWPGRQRHRLPFVQHRASSGPYSRFFGPMQLTLRYTDPDSLHPCRPLDTRVASSDSGYETGNDSESTLLTPTETTSLLAHAISPSSSTRDILATAEEGDSKSPTVVGITPVPTKQLVVLCICRIADPVAFTQIFPYINEMLASLAIEDERLPFYAGLVESVFAIAQLSTIYLWARLSDRFGRRPIIFVGAMGMAMSTLLFGTSKSLPAVLIARSSGA